MIGRTLAHYRILGELGRGGMGVVYEAEDQKLKRRVALKVLRPELAADAERLQRFRREAQVVAGINHPGVVTLYSVEEQDGEEHEHLFFLAMELVEGEPLSDRIAAPGLPTPDLLSLAIPLADAVAAAHDRGVTHRDLKPANVLVTDDGRVKVLDFGLAKLLDSRDGNSDASRTGTDVLTREGLILGTVAYMSPEQAQGRPVDVRSDVFSLGVILYELATGHRPFGGDNDISILSAILRDSPEPVSGTRQDLPLALDRIVSRCLSKEPGERYSSARQLVEELKALEQDLAAGRAEQHRRRRSPPWLPATVGAVLLAGLVAGWLATRERRTTAPREPSPQAAPETAPAASATRIVVLPFKNLTEDPSLETVGVMAADWVTQGLSATGRLQAVPTQLALTAAQQAAAESGTPGAPSWLESVARLTGAGTVIDGSLYLDGDNLQLRAQISNAAEGTLMAAVEPVETPRSDPTQGLETLRQRILGTIATLIDPELGSVAGLVSRPPSFAAYEAFVAGMERYTSMDFRGAIERLEQAAATDPDYATPLLMAASAHYNLGEYARADEIVHRLLPRQESLAPLDRYNLDWLAAECRGDRATALRAARRAAELSPRSHWTFRFGVVALMSNYPKEARDAMLSLDPERGFVRGWVAFSYHYASALHYLGEHQAELAEARRARSVSPDSIGALGIEIRALAAMGRIDAVEALAAESVRFAPEWFETPGTTMTLAARELRAHGYPEAAQPLAERSIAWHRALPPREASQIPQRENLGRVLFQAGYADEAREIFEALLAETPDNVEYRGTLGVLAAQRGDAGATAQADEWLRNLDRPYLFGENFYWRAAIAAWSDRQDEAVELLRQALARGRPFHWRAERDLHLDPMLLPIWQHPGFLEILAPKG